MFFIKVTAALRKTGTWSCFSPNTVSTSCWHVFSLQAALLKGPETQTALSLSPAAPLLRQDGALGVPAEARSRGGLWDIQPAGAEPTERGGDPRDGGAVAAAHAEPAAAQRAQERWEHALQQRRWCNVENKVIILREKSWKKECRLDLFR